MARVTIKKVNNGYQVSLFRRPSGSKKIVKDDLGIFKMKKDAERQASLARQLVKPLKK